MERFGVVKVKVKVYVDGSNEGEQSDVTVASAVTSTIGSSQGSSRDVGAVRCR